MDKRRRPYEFDVAISFAGEERRYARDLAETLRAKGLSVFYDEHHKARLWGKDEREFERIYGPGSRFVAPIISSSYVRKTWTRFEFDTALREERNRSSESILPIRADGARLPGLHDGRFYLSLEENSIQDIAACIIEKCRELDRPAMPQSRGRSAPKPKVAVLSSGARHALGIVVTSPIPLPQGFHEALFPDIDWPKQSRILLGFGLVHDTKGLLAPSTDAVEAIRADEAEWKSCSDRWLARLEELKEHPDIALLLSIRYKNERRWGDAVGALVGIANGGLYRPYNSLYASVLRHYVHPKILRRLGAGSRISLYHALAICAAQDGRFTDASTWFEKVRKASLRTKDHYWLGQYHLNSGVALDRSGDPRGAAAAYERAIAHGKQHDDPLIVGRALGNLSQLRLSQGEPDSAIDLMHQSIEWKDRAKDDSGSAICEAQLGTIHAARADLQEALAHFERAESLCGEQDRTYDQAKVAHSLGNVHFELGRPSKALRAYKKAARLADADSYPDVRLLAMIGIARVLHQRGRFADLEEEFRAFHESPLAADDVEARLTAYHGMGVTQAMQRKVPEARENFREALKLARRHDDPEWVAKVLAALAALADDAPFQDPPPKQLVRLADRETKKGNNLVAHHLWTFAARGFVRDDSAEDADTAYVSALRCLDGEPGREKKQIGLYFDLFAYRWISARYEAALESLSRAEDLARRHRFEVERAKAIDERGLALQRLGRAEEAIPLHLRAAGIAREHGLLTQLRISLNNLGQAYRRVGRYQEALAPLRESEVLARAAGDYEDALGTMVNRGIVLDESGERGTAAAVLRKCSTEAERREEWGGYAMAQEAIGNLAWHRGWLDRAERHYRIGHSAAKKHGLRGREAEIAVNLASLLEKRGDIKRALQLLEAYEDDFARMMEAHVCHDILAGLYAASGDREGARRNWEKGRSSAQAIGDRDYIALCSANLARLHEADSQFGAAGCELEVALAHECEPELRAGLLADLLRVALAHRDETKAEQVFAEVGRLAAKHELSGILVNIHLYVADYNWREDMKAKRDALRAYVAALVTAVSRRDLEGYPELVGHIVTHLTSHGAPSEEEFVSLLDGLKGDFPALVDGSNEGAAAVLWPFEAARRLFPFKDDKRRYLAELRKIARSS